MLRTLWYYIVLFISTVIHASTAVVASLLGVSLKPGGIYDWCARDWVRWDLWAAGTPVLVDGMERIPHGTPFVAAANHTSLFDILALSLVLPGSVRFVAKEELTRIPLFGRAMRVAGNVPIERTHKAHAIEAYHVAADTIRRGVSMVVFPEGTRSRTGDLLPFKNAPFGLAIAAQVPLIPVYVQDTFRILPKGAWRLHPQPIRVFIGEPIPTDGLTLQDRIDLRDRTRAAIQALRTRVDAPPPHP
ncbi:MAG TPA: lysophospholipid acyltransferase family protein [Gemmatimonadales bacterium]|nr:lysophospholipid acyltransferase family protein [Gemmatimonadales bacterium]